MSTTHDHPHITGNWTPADGTKNTLELAPTDRDEVVALRDSYDQGKVIFATSAQVMTFADAVSKGPIRNLLLKGM